MPLVKLNKACSVRQKCCRIRPAMKPLSPVTENGPLFLANVVVYSESTSPGEGYPKKYTHTLQQSQPGG